MKIVPFNEAYLQQVIQLTDDYWNKEYEGQSDTLKKIVFEFIVRKNYYKSEYDLMIIEDDVLRGILFGYSKDMQNDVKEWLDSQMPKLNEKETSIVNTLANYLFGFDELMDTHLTENDRKVALFISNIQGGGTALLNQFSDNSKFDSIENIYLWTDSTCNHSYYPKRGFELFFTERYKLEQSQDETIETMFYRKKLDCYNKKKSSN